MLRDGRPVITELTFRHKAGHQVPFSVLSVEIDGMRHFRAQYGASAVTAILRLAAQTIESSIRPTDSLGSYTENKFLTILPECSGTEVKPVADRLLRMVHNAKLKWWGDNVSLTASFGAASAITGDTERSIMERAEKLLVERINAGGDRVTVAE